MKELIKEGEVRYIQLGYREEEDDVVIVFIGQDANDKVIHVMSLKEKQQ